MWSALIKGNIPEPPVLATGDDMIERVRPFKLLGRSVVQ